MNRPTPDVFPTKENINSLAVILQRTWHSTLAGEDMFERLARAALIEQRRKFEEECRFEELNT